MVKPVLSLLGSTGSIGEQTLDVVRRRGYRVAALAANRSVDTLYRQALEFRPELDVYKRQSTTSAGRQRGLRAIC